jgi:putative Holliday junction resolvase
VGRILAVDPGEKRIGLALSDPTGTLATPLSVLRHTSREQDAAAIVQLARDKDVSCILVGLALDREGQEGPQARRALRLVAQLRLLTDLPVETRDESGTTESAAALGPASSPLDARAAAVLLQEYLDASKS